MKTRNIDKVFFRVREIAEMGYPLKRTEELARQIGRKSNPEAGSNSPFLLTLEEVQKHFGY